MLLVLHYRGSKWTFLNPEGVLVWVKFARWRREIKALFLPPSFWLVYLACQSLASPPAACCIPRDLEPSRIYGCASSLCLWGLRCHYSLCLGGSGWQQKGWRGEEGWGWQNESWRWQVLGLGVDFIPPVGAVPLGISNEILCGDNHCHWREGSLLHPRRDLWYRASLSQDKWVFNFLWEAQRLQPRRRWDSLVTMCMGCIGLCWPWSIVVQVKAAGCFRGGFCLSSCGH